MHKTRTPNTKSEMFCSRWTINNDIWVRFAPLLPFANKNTVVQSRWLSKGETEITENREYCWNCELLKENIDPTFVIDWHFPFQIFRTFFSFPFRNSKGWAWIQKAIEFDVSCKCDVFTTLPLISTTKLTRMTAGRHMMFVRPVSLALDKKSAFGRRSRRWRM